MELFKSFKQGIKEFFKSNENNNENLSQSLNLSKLNEEENNTNEKNILNLIPTNIQLIFFHYLEPTDLIRLQSVCKMWYILTNYYSLWKNIYFNLPFNVWTNYNPPKTENKEIKVTNFCV